MLDETKERTEGPTPNGGTYAIAFFRDDQGNDVPKLQATNVIVVEYNSKDEPIFRTHATLGDRGSVTNKDLGFSRPEGAIS